MNDVAKKTDPQLWDKVKHETVEADKGGRPGQWSARKAQLASAEYKRKGGGYEGGKSQDNHLQQWTDEAWGTRSGGKSENTGERYLPKKAREALSDRDYARTTAKKRQDAEQGRQFSRQPEDVARKTAPHRRRAVAGSKAELYAAATAKNVPKRSKMTKAQLAAAVGRA